MDIRKLFSLFILATSILVGGCIPSDVSPNTSTQQRRITGFYYSFNETGAVIIDNSGNNYDGSPSGISRVPGKIGNAVQFIGTGSTIALTPIFDYFPFADGFSFRAWIKIAQPITTKQQIIGATGGGSTAAIVDNFGISLVNDSISFEIPAQQNLLSITTNPLSFPLNTWFHIALTYDGNLISFYYNGSLVYTNSILTTFNSSFNNQIGNNQRIFGGLQIENQFIGQIDELYLENKILTQSEIATYYINTM